jgi:putative transposase
VRVLNGDLEESTGAALRATRSAFHHVQLLPETSPARHSEEARRFLKILDEVRERYQFSLVGYVVMPEHIHLLISEPRLGNPSTVMQALKQRVARSLRGKGRRRNRNQLPLWRDERGAMPRSFWQKRSYGFNVCSGRKGIEKLNYMHMNRVKRGLVTDPKLWAWSSYRFYQYGEKTGCTPDVEPR